MCKRKCYKNEDCSGLEKCYDGECQESCIDDSDCPQSNRKCLGGRCGYDCKCKGKGKCEKCLPSDGGGGGGVIPTGEANLKMFFTSIVNSQS